jgi:hypothetical protein
MYLTLTIVLGCWNGYNNIMKKIPRPLKSNKSNKENALSDDEIDNTFLDKVNESIEEIDSTIKQLLKNPPPITCPLNEFKDVHKLPHEGINPHRLKIDKDVLEIETV